MNSRHHSIEHSGNQTQDVKDKTNEHSFEYTFDANKNKGKTSPSNANEEKERILDFKDPYMNLGAPFDDREDKIQNIFDKLDKFMKKNKQTNSTRSLGYRGQGSLNQGINRGHEHHYSASVRDLHQDTSREVWQKSYDLLDKLNSDRTNRLQRYKLDRFSLGPGVNKDILSEVSNYKLKQKYSQRSSSRQKDSNRGNSKASGSRSVSKLESNNGQKRTRNNTVRTYTEISPAPGRESPRFILHNKDMINEMLRLLNPKSSQTSFRF